MTLILSRLLQTKESLMRCFAALILMLSASLSSAADILTVDPGGNVIVVGSAATTPSTGEVRIGGGQVKAGGAVTAANVIINRTTQATAKQAVRGDDPRLSDARPANGGNADTVDGKHAADLVDATQKGAANGVATLDAGGKIPSSQLPLMGPQRDIQFFSTSGNFTVPAGVARVFVKVWGGGGGGGIGQSPNGYSVGGGGGGYAFGKVIVTSGQVIPITVGSGGWNGDGNTVPTDGGSSSFGSYVAASGGKNGWSNSPYGFGGSGISGDLLLNGGSGGGSPNSGSTVPGPGGAAPFGGAGGHWNPSLSSARDGMFPGGGGSSGYGSTLVRGGKGGAGFVIVEW